MNPLTLFRRLTGTKVSPAPAPGIDAAAVKSWKDNGFLVLPNFYSPTQIDEAEAVVQQVWKTPPGTVVCDDLVTGKRDYLKNIRAADRVSHRFKVNDLYLECEAIRKLGINPRLTPILDYLIGARMVLINSLNFEKGSEQGLHIDSLFMTPSRVGELVAIWVALEDCHPDSGPLVYYPGSHKIPLYRFSNGAYHYVPEEMPLWHKYIDKKIEAAGLQPQSFHAHKGDVFIWSANLVHGGGPIRDKERTRKSLVCHYWTLESCKQKAIGECVRFGPGYWLRRSHQAVAA